MSTNRYEMKNNWCKNLKTTKTLYKKYFRESMKLNVLYTQIMFDKKQISKPEER